MEKLLICLMFSFVIFSCETKRNPYHGIIYKDSIETKVKLKIDSVLFEEQGLVNKRTYSDSIRYEYKKAIYVFVDTILGKTFYGVSIHSDTNDIRDERFWIDSLTMKIIGRDIL